MSDMKFMAVDEIDRNHYTRQIEEARRNLSNLEQQLEEAKQNGDKSDIKDVTIEIKKCLFHIERQKNALNNLRDATLEDISERKLIMSDYAKMVEGVIPDDVPIVFHGRPNIGTVEKIIEEGGIFNPGDREDRGHQGDCVYVTNKWKIDVSLEFADLRGNFKLPYGALFAIMPKLEEYQEVFNSKNGTELTIGSVNFREEPESLVAIITTRENIERLRKKARESGIDENKVMTHDAFLKLCKEKYSDHIYKAR